MKFFIAGTPIPQGSMNGYVRGGKVILTSSQGNRLLKWRNQIKAEAHERGTELKGPVKVSLNFVLPRPRSRKNEEWVRVKPDLDKLIRAVLDACTGPLWADDSQVCSIVATKRYAEGLSVPGVEITAESITL